MYILQAEILPAMQEGQCLGTLVGKLLFHHEGGRHLVALVEIAVDYESVQLRPQRDGFDEGRHHNVKHGVGELRFRLVEPCQVLVHGRQVHPQGDVCLVVATVGIDDAGDKMQRIQFPQQPSIPAVAPALFLFFHFYSCCLFFRLIKNSSHYKTQYSKSKAVFPV